MPPSGSKESVYRADFTCGQRHVPKVLKTDPASRVGATPGPWRGVLSARMRHRGSRPPRGRNVKEVLHRSPLASASYAHDEPLCGFVRIRGVRLEPAPLSRSHRHARSYDVVRGHHITLRVRHHERYVKVRGVRRFRVVERQQRFVVLAKASSAASTAVVVLPGVPESVGRPSWASSALTGAEAGSGNDGKSSTRWSASSRPTPSGGWSTWALRGTCGE